MLPYLLQTFRRPQREDWIVFENSRSYLSLIFSRITNMNYKIINFAFTAMAQR
jgi:hypothetical protein